MIEGFTSERDRIDVHVDGSVLLSLHLAADGPVAATGLAGASGPRSEARLVQPLVEILAVGHGHAVANHTGSATAIGARLRYRRHEIDARDGGALLVVEQHDPVTGLTAHSSLWLPASAGGVECWTSVVNEGPDVVWLQSVSSLMIGQPIGAVGIAATSSIEGRSDWLGEFRWISTGLRSATGLVDVDLAAHYRQDARGARTIVGRGTWSSGERVPAGVLAAGADGPALAWQVRHNGGWRVELRERLGREGDGVLVLGLFGPGDADHGWLEGLEPGATFRSVPVCVAGSPLGSEAAAASMTTLRRALHGPRRDGAPYVVFNDYMNTLMGDPTTSTLLPLIDAAGRAGAEVFCVDAGWYDDGGDWWDSVGQWEPSTTRFPDGGLERVMAAIRSAGMAPGLWLEPEVVGVRSPVAEQLPPEAFLQRHGVRVVEHGRYLLDLRHPAAVAHLDGVVDRLVGDFGLAYLKLDYNVTPGPGTDRAASSVGAGLLEHNRAHLAWLDGVRSRHPGLMLENCASGGMRADDALLARSELQSTSDQQTPLLYPPIAAGALLAVLPEQAANWAYPQAAMSDEEIAFTMCTGLAGRLYLSGRLDLMDARQLRPGRRGRRARQGVARAPARRGPTMADRTARLGGPVGRLRHLLRGRDARQRLVAGRRSRPRRPRAAGRRGLGALPPRTPVGVEPQP